MLSETKAQAEAAIKAEFPDAKVLFLDQPSFMDGIGVEYKGLRNAFKIDTPENWRDAATRLIEWMRKS
jgi:hypothetical protein